MLSRHDGKRDNARAVSKENVEAVRRVFEAGAANRIEPLLAFLPEDVVWYLPSNWVEEHEYRGHEGVRRVMAIWLENFDGYSADPVELREAGDDVVGLIRLSGRIKSSRTVVEQRLGAVYSDIRDGQVHRASFFLSWEEALEAAGLDPSEARHT